ncbi:MAG: hypothetical protein JNM69_41595 [Archangium sp.]|nr:hypothetical protein [Archangium sp.]
MRASLVAGLVAVFSLLVLVRSSRAEPPPAMERRQVTEVLAALKKAKADPTTISGVRWYAEVLHETELLAPVGSVKTELGPWGENGPLMAAESGLGDCAPADPADAKVIAALFKEYGNALSPGLRGYALAQAGRVDEAAALYRQSVLTMKIEGPCPSEHPMYSGRRVGHMNRLLSCLKRWQPKADWKPVEKAIERAQACAANNHAVG